MHIKVERSADFYRVLEWAYDRLTRSSSDETLLEVSLAPGNYEGTNFKAIDRDGGGKIALWVRAEDPQQPPVLSDGSFTISGREIQLDNIIFKNTYTSGPIISLVARDRICVTGCAFAELKRDAYPDDEALIEMRPSFEGGVAPTLQIRDSCFIANEQRSPSYLIDLAAPNHAWEQVDFQQVVFVQNKVDRGLRVGGTEQIKMRECFLDFIPTFFAIDSAYTALSISHSTLIGEPVIQERASLSQPQRITPAYLKSLEREGSERFNFIDNHCYDSLGNLDLEYWIQAVSEGTIPTPNALTKALSGD